jgi:hypothetical protein
MRLGNPSRNLISIALRWVNERRTGPLQCPSHGTVAGESRPPADQAAAGGATSDTRAASTQPLLDLGVLREVFAPRAHGASAANYSMGCRDIKRPAAAVRPLYQVRSQGRDLAASRMGRRRSRLPAVPRGKARKPPYLGSRNFGLRNDSRALTLRESDEFPR